MRRRDVVAGDALVATSRALGEPAPLRPEQAAAVAALAGEAWSPNTKRVYSWAWGVFEAWCAAEGRVAFPADVLTVAAFIESQVTANVAWASLSLQMAAIGRRHDLAKAFSPTRDPQVRMVLRGAARRLGKAAKNARDPAAGPELEAMLAAIDRTTLEGKRDAAVLLVGFYTALRRSNLAALEVTDFTPTPGGLAVRVRRSKTDQAGEGATVGVAEHGGPLCAVTALREWWAAAGITDGLAFRAFDFAGQITDHFSAKTVERIVKRWAGAVGLKPSAFGGHSLRAGFVTEAIRRGASDAEIMGTTLHKRTEMIVKYRREADPVARGASKKVKLGRG